MIYLMSHEVGSEEILGMRKYFMKETGIKKAQIVNSTYKNDAFTFIVELNKTNGFNWETEDVVRFAEATKKYSIVWTPLTFEEFVSIEGACMPPEETKYRSI